LKDPGSRAVVEVAVTNVAAAVAAARRRKGDGNECVLGCSATLDTESRGSLPSWNQCKRPVEGTEWTAQVVKHRGRTQEAAVVVAVVVVVVII